MATQFPSLLAADKIRDSFQVSYEKRLVPGSTIVYQVVLTLELTYHMDVKANSTSSNATFAAFMKASTETDPVVLVGSKSAKFNGDWNVSRKTCDDNHDGTSRITVTLWKEGQADTLAALTEEELEAILEIT